MHAQPDGARGHREAAQGNQANRDRCRCLGQRLERPPRGVKFHRDRQNTEAAGWRRLLELIDEAADDRREEFRPLAELSAEERREIVTLPPTIAKLTSVRHFVLYGSNLVRVPPEIGAMRSLEEFTPYTSYRLHWLPYEITRCPGLLRSTVSTRALYGNFTFRPPFPTLQPPTAGESAELDLSRLDTGRWGSTAIRSCSVCSGPIRGIDFHQVWISLRVATDVLPLLVNACSETCTQGLARPAEGYVQTPHRGGFAVTQPAADYSR